MFVVSSPENVVEQCQGGEEFYLNCPDEATHIINNLPVTVPPSLAEAKTKKRREISTEFDTSLSSGRVQSSLGFAIDARRSGTKNDADNLLGLLRFMKRNNVATVTITDADDVDHPGIDMGDVEILLEEITNHGVSLFEGKRLRVAALNAATTLAEVETV
jgi:hypothetical protein